MIIIDEFKDDDKAFIFTLKNPHGVEPTRFMKRKESEYVIICDPYDGPIFGDDIILFNQFFEENSYYIHNNGEGAYEYHPEYKSSLYVNTNSPDRTNFFTLLDYEVYTHNE